MGLVGVSALTVSLTAVPGRFRAHGVPLLLALGLVLSLALFVAVAAAYVDGGSMVDLDLRVASWVAANMPAWAEWLARPFTWAGGLFGITIVSAVAVITLERSGHRADAMLVIAVAAGSFLLTTGLKQVYARARPDAGSAITLPHSYSFPSGHAATGIAVFGVLAVLAAERARTQRARVLWLLCGFALGAAVGASRIVLNVHFLSDVIAGFCVGLAWLCACLLVRELAAGRAA
jgi:undecaprenyl-diphosphatase